MILMALRNLDIGDPLIRATVKVAHCLVGPPATCLSHRVAGVEAERGAEGVGNMGRAGLWVSPHCPEPAGKHLLELHWLKFSILQDRETAPKEAFFRSPSSSTSHLGHAAIITSVLGDRACV